MSDELLDPERELISLQRFAKMIDTPEKTIRHWVRTSYCDLQAYKVGKRIKFKLADIRKWYGKMRVGAKAA
jgi:hypothetical protein